MLEVHRSAAAGSRHGSAVRLRVIGRRLDGAPDAADVFARLTDGGKRPGSVLLESGDLAPTYAERSIGVVEPSLSVCGRGTRAQIEALDELGELLLPEIGEALPPAVSVSHPPKTLLVTDFETRPLPSSFEERLRCCPHLDILRTVIPTIVCADDDSSPIGLYGCFAYDLVRHFEDIPLVTTDPLDEPDYLFYLATRLFVVNHIRKETMLLVAVPECTTEHDAEAKIKLDEMESAFRNTEPTRSAAVSVGTLQSDTPCDRFISGVERIKTAIVDGNVFQVVYGRMMSAEFSGDMFAVYRALKHCNPSPFLFYMRDHRGVLMGASPELAVRVASDGKTRIVEIKPIAGTKPRGLVDGKIDPELDARYEVALKVDAKELAEHTMLIDLARNDVASIAKPGTTRLHAAFAVEKYSHVQHLVSHIRGQLRDNFDALDAYAATMNMGTLTGAPKPEAMRMIAELEQSARGFFGGGVGFINAAGEMETTIVIRAMRMLDDRVYIRAGAGIVADSVPQNEWDETERKAAACFQALREAADGR